MSRPVEYLSPSDPGATLNADSRSRARDSVATGVDVLVIGGGITGVGVALDAASRGLTTALIERDDLAAGTSRWSSKLVHGGLRYLAKGDVAVAWESATERAIVAGRIAPHLIHALPQVVPDYESNRSCARLALAGFVAGDSMRIAARTPRGLLPHSRRISAAEAQELVPGIKTEGLLGAALGWDCQLEDDARLVVAIARTAAAYGAHILTRNRADSVDAESGVVGVTDELSGEAYAITARRIVNATGVWAGELDPSITLHPSLGSHAVIPTSLLGDGKGSLTVQVPGHVGRFVFAVPQPDGLTYVGLTDNELDDGIPREPVAAPQDDLEWILSILSQALERPVGLADVVGSFAGVRPLVDAGSGESSDISRRHFIHEDRHLITITGGKLTTYRRMAEDVVDLISDSPCRTKNLAVVGAGPRPPRSDVPERLWRRFGNEAPDVWDLGMDDPGLREPVVPGFPVLGVEVEFAIRNELALLPEDVVDRRTRIGLLYEEDGFPEAVARRFEHPRAPAALSAG